jgi:hypothetical protein
LFLNDYISKQYLFTVKLEMQWLTEGNSLCVKNVRKSIIHLWLCENLLLEKLNANGCAREANGCGLSCSAAWREK